MVKDYKTVFDLGATVQENGTTLFESSGISPASTDTPITKGMTLLDTYRVEIDAIESGGMGQVWRVHHTSWNVDLAMKRPRAQYFANEKDKVNFIHECEAWIDLGLHPNIVSCYYVREIHNVPTIFSEWMDGGSLESAIQRKTLYEGTQAAQNVHLLDIAIQFARGLRYAHDVGLIHQDVKPDNVLLTAAGEAKVADFGLARARAALTLADGTATAQNDFDAGKTTVAHSGAYTPAYCSMEQMEGKALTRRTDIYSWAVSVMEMYLGDRPWAYGRYGNGVVAGLNCRNYFKEARVTMPDALKELLAQCMDAEPDNRPYDFEKIEARLHGIYKDETGSPYPRPVAKAAADTADSLNNRALSMIDLGKTEAAERAWATALSCEPTHLLTRYNLGLHGWHTAKTGDDDVLRSIDYCLDDEMRRELRQAILEESGLTQSPFRLPTESAANGALTGAHFLPDGSALFACEGGLYLAAANTLEVRKLIDTDQITSLSVSRDGKLAATTHELPDRRYALRVWELPVSRLRLESIEPMCFKCSCFSPDGSLLYIGGWQTYDYKGHTILSMSMSDGHIVIAFDHTGYCDALCLSPDGRTLVSVPAGYSAVYVFDTLSGQNLKGSPYRIENTATDGALPVPYTAYSACFGADGKRLYIGGGDANIHVRELASFKETAVFPGHKKDVTALYIRGERLVSGDQNGTVKLYELPGGRCLATIPGPAGSLGVKSVTLREDMACILAGSSGGEALLIPLDQEPKRAMPRLALISDVERRLRAEAAFREELALSEQALGDGDIKGALNRLYAACAVPGYSKHEDYLSLSHRIGRFCKKRGLRAAWCKLHKDTGAPILSVAVRPDGALLTGYKKGSIVLWDAASGEALRRTGAYDVRQYALYALPDGTVLAKKDDYTLLRLSADNHEPVWSYCYHPDHSVLAFMPVMRGRSIFLLTQDAKTPSAPVRRVGLLDLNAQKAHLFTTNRYDCTAVCCENGKFALVSNANGVERLDLIKRKATSGFMHEGSRFLQVMALSHNGRLCTVQDTASHELSLWDHEKSVCLWRMKCGSGINNAVFSEDDLHLLIGLEDARAMLLNAVDGSVLLTLNEHVKAVNAVCFAPDDCMLLTGSSDFSFCLFELDWDYEFPGFADWDEGAKPYLEIFLTLHPKWTENDEEELVAELQTRGYGYIRPEGVRAKLAEMTDVHKKNGFGLFGKNDPCNFL